MGRGGEGHFPGDDAEIEIALREICVCWMCVGVWSVGGSLNSLSVWRERIAEEEEELELSSSSSWWEL